MTTIAILSENAGLQSAAYRAIAGDKESVGSTAGEALDALTAQLDEDDAGTLIIVQQQRPDQFFSAPRQKRLAELMARWRRARDQRNALPPNEHAELEALVEEELRGATKRAGAVNRELES